MNVQQERETNIILYYYIILYTIENNFIKLIRQCY